MASFNWPPGGSGGGGGMVTGAANVGTGVGVFQVLSGSTLNFRSVTNGTGITWVQNANDIQGTVTLAPFSTTDLAEGTNLYYTQARFDTAFAGKTTTNLAEGTNLYYTAARFNTAFAGKTTTDLAEGTNLYYTQARFDTAFAAKDTDDLAEGATNLYFTQARARLSISGTAPVDYDNTTGVISMHVADATHDGYLSQTDWSTFDGKFTPVNVTQGAAGLVQSAGQLLGTNTNDDAASGYTGEYLELSGSNPGITTNTGSAGTGNLTLTAGDWDVIATCHYLGSGAVANSLIAGVTQTSGTITGTAGKDYSVTGTGITATDNNGTVVSPTVRVSVPNATTVDVSAVGFAVFVAGTVDLTGFIRARRVR